MWFSAHFEEDALFLKMLVAALYYNVLTLLIVFFLVISPLRIYFSVSFVDLNCAKLTVTHP